MSSRFLTPAAEKGFTLIEVMIAVGITAIIGALGLGAFQRVHAAKEIIEAHEERYGGARLALSRMAREISMAFISEHYDRKRFRERPTIFRGKDGGDRDSLLFTTMAHERLVRDVKESDQALVEYALDRDPDHPGEEALFRREKVHLDEDPETGGSRAAVCDHVAAFDVSYFDWKRGEWVNEWSSGSVEHQGQLPTRVRLRLDLKMPDGNAQRFETEARVAITRPLDF